MMMDVEGGVVSVASKSEAGLGGDGALALSTKMLESEGFVRGRPGRGVSGRRAGCCCPSSVPSEGRSAETGGLRRRELGVTVEEELVGVTGPSLLGVGEGRGTDRAGDPAAFWAEAEVGGILGTDRESVGCGRVPAVPATDAG